MVVKINEKSYNEDFVLKAIYFYTALLNGTFEKELQKEFGTNE